MGLLADRLDSMVVTVSTDNGRITAELRNRRDVGLTFQGNGYGRYDERELERHLANLARLLWAARTRRHYEALSEAYGETITGERPSISPRDIQYDTERERILARGTSTDGHVEIACRGLRVWTVRLRDGTVRALDEEGFGLAVRQAAHGFLADHNGQIRELKQRVYAGPGVR